MQGVGVIIPAFNESENIFILLGKIFHFLPSATVLIVDDSNPLENKKLINSLTRIPAQQRKQVTVVSRNKKSGRGSAVRDGLTQLQQNKKITYFFEMDADLAHDPKDFQKFFDAVKKNKADVVIGSRYLENSTIEKWPLWRLVLSKLYNKGINVWLNLNLSDYTNGFRLYNRRAVEFLTKITLREKGFIALSEIAYRLKSNNFVVVEIPITFTDRTHGKSNATGKEYLSALLGILRIKLLPLRRKNS